MSDETKITLQDRGNLRADFKDVEGFGCFIRDGGIAGEQLLHLGAFGTPMVLSRNHVRALLPFMEAFVETGRLESPEPEQSRESALEELTGLFVKAPAELSKRVDSEPEDPGYSLDQLAEDIQKSPATLQRLVDLISAAKYATLARGERDWEKLLGKLETMSMTVLNKADTVRDFIG